MDPFLINFSSSIDPRIRGRGRSRHHLDEGGNPYYYSEEIEIASLVPTEDPCEAENRLIEMTIDDGGGGGGSKSKLELGSTLSFSSVPSKLDSITVPSSPIGLPGQDFKESEFFKEHGCHGCGMLDHQLSENKCDSIFKLSWANRKPLKKMTMAEGDFKDYYARRDERWKKRLDKMDLIGLKWDPLKKNFIKK